MIFPPKTPSDEQRLLDLSIAHETGEVYKALGRDVLLLANVLNDLLSITADLVETQRELSDKVTLLMVSFAQRERKHAAENKRTGEMP